MSAPLTVPVYYVKGWSSYMIHGTGVMLRGHSKGPRVADVDELARSILRSCRTTETATSSVTLEAGKLSMDGGTRK